MFLWSKLITQESHTFNSPNLQFISKEKLMYSWKVWVFWPSFVRRRGIIYVTIVFDAENGIMWILKKLTFQTWKLFFVLWKIETEHTFSSDVLLWLISCIELCSYASERQRTFLEIEILEKLWTSLWLWPFIFLCDFFFHWAYKTVSHCSELRWLFPWKE